ncbi:MAG: hypothetical protein F8N37_00600 [Telmatospirillum sp.]|nr:hypothetical protein [Telmatospirillum sp.]
MVSSARRHATSGGSAIALDKCRIQRALEDRQRYRYVSPRVREVDGGFLIDSPCCSRTVDPEGGYVDIAFLRHEPDTGGWWLYRKNHAIGEWECDSIHARLVDLLRLLCGDPLRRFWQ